MPRYSYTSTKTNVLSQPLINLIGLNLTINLLINEFNQNFNNDVLEEMLGNYSNIYSHF